MLVYFDARRDSGHEYRLGSVSRLAQGCQKRAQLWLR
jgi:hypothetical protein